MPPPVPPANLEPLKAEVPNVKKHVREILRKCQRNDWNDWTDWTDWNVKMWKWWDHFSSFFRLWVAALAESKWSSGSAALSRWGVPAMPRQRPTKAVDISDTAEVYRIHCIDWNHIGIILESHWNHRIARWEAVWMRAGKCTSKHRSIHNIDPLFSWSLLLSAPERPQVGANQQALSNVTRWGPNHDLILVTMTWLSCTSN
jgi:hypothetical protein